EQDAPYAPGAGSDCRGPGQTSPGHPGLHQSTRAQPDRAVLANTATCRRRLGCVIDVFPPRRKSAASSGASMGAPESAAGAPGGAPLAPVPAALAAPRVGVAGTLAWGSVMVHRLRP